MPKSIRILIVDDSVEDALRIVGELERSGFSVEFERVETAAGLASALQTRDWEVVFSDYSLAEFNGPAALELCHQRQSEVPFVCVSGTPGEQIAVEMIKAGAQNYLTKDNLALLGAVVAQALNAGEVRRIQRESEADTSYLASLVESCNDAIIGQTLDGKIVSWNAGAERLYGYGAAETVGRSVSDLIPKYRPDAWQEISAQIRKGRSIEGLETVHLRKDQTAVEVSLTISPVRGRSGRIIGASMVARDITQRRMEENERLALIQDLTSALTHSNAFAQRVKRV